MDNLFSPRDFQEGDLVATPDGSIGQIIGLYPVFDLDRIDYYVQINDEIEIHLAVDLTLAQL